jgi:hypothetical protein
MNSIPRTWSQVMRKYSFFILSCNQFKVTLKYGRDISSSYYSHLISVTNFQDLLAVSNFFSSQKVVKIIVFLGTNFSSIVAYIEPRFCKIFSSSNQDLSKFQVGHASSCRYDDISYVRLPHFCEAILNADTIWTKTRLASN